MTKTINARTKINTRKQGTVIVYWKNADFCTSVATVRPTDRMSFLFLYLSILSNIIVLGPVVPLLPLIQTIFPWNFCSRNWSHG